MDGPYKKTLDKIMKGAGIAAAGAVVTYLLGQLDYIDVGVWTPLFVAASSSLVNALQTIIKYHVKNNPSTHANGAATN